MTNVVSVPCDDLALVLMDVLKIGQVTAPAAHQKFRAARADGIVAAAAVGRLERELFHQLRQREDVAPYRPRGGNLLGIGAYAQWNVQRGIAMNQHQHLGIVDAAQCDAEKIADANVDASRALPMTAVTPGGRRVSDPRRTSAWTSNPRAINAAIRGRPTYPVPPVTKMGSGTRFI